MSMSEKVTRLNPIAGDRASNVFSRSHDHVEPERPEASADPRADIRETLAPKQARATIFVVGGVLAAVIALILITLMVNSIMDYKLASADRPQAAEPAATPPVVVPPVAAKPPHTAAQPSQQEVADAQKKLGDALLRMTAPAPEAPPAAQTSQPQAAPQNVAPPPPPVQARIETQPEKPRAAPPPAADEVSKLLARASSLIREGQIASARSLLELASRSNDPSVAFALAETWDPKTLARWRAIGISGDAERARTLYRQAAAGGFTEANARLADLDR